MHYSVLNVCYEGNYFCSKKLWIGASDVAMESRFTWPNTQILGYEKWAANEPNEAASPEDCVAMDEKTSFWGDESCGLLLESICQKGEVNTTCDDEVVCVNASGAFGSEIHACLELDVS